MASPPRILVVEDNPVTRRMFRAALATEGYAVLEAPDGRTALELAASTPSDLVIQDVVLPDIDGFELVARLRALETMADVPILAVSGFLTRAESTRAVSAGFTELLVKPIGPEQLLRVVSGYLPTRGAAGQQPGRGRRVLVADDDPIQLKLTRVHLARLGFEVETAADGREALARARESAPDAILSDVLMPNLDGFELCMAVRRDPGLASVPVVLASSRYVEVEDRALAVRVGANDLVARTPDLGEVVPALLAGIRRGAPLAAGVPEDVAQAERLRRVAHQLERHAVMNAELFQQASLQATILSVLAVTATRMSERADASHNPGELLAALMDAGGISVGALYLVGPDGRLRLEGPSSYAGPAPDDAAGFFDQPALFEQAFRADEPLKVPSPPVPEPVARALLGRLDVASVLLAPLALGSERLGLLFLASHRRDLSSPDWLAFVQTMTGQIAQTLALGRTFARLAASEQRYRGLFDRVPVGLFRTTPEGRLLDANPATVEVLGFPDRSTLLATPAAALYADPADRQRLLDLLARDGVVRGFETRLRRRDGRPVWTRINLRTVEEAGETVHDGSLEDITERKAAEARLARQQEVLAQTEKLAAMGQLLAGVAHELNNPLAIVLGQASLLAGKLDAGPLRERAQKISLAAERCARIVRNFLALARQRPPERCAVRLGDVVREAVELLAYPLRVDGVEVRLDLAAGLPELWADPHQLHQVVVNLVSNAHDAMRGTAGPRRLVLTTRSEAEGRRVVLEVADSGPGIPADVRSRIFEPFFTTKPPGQGTGLGLSLCHGILAGHGGTIAVEEAHGQGAVFRVALPVATPSGPARQPEEEAPPVTGRTILVVDDETQVADVLADLLAVDGHRVETAANGAVALEKLRHRAYDAILSDLRMPELDGPGLYRELARRAPELARRFVFLTGDTLSAELTAFLQETGAPSVGKPFAPDELRRALRRVLGSR